MSDAFDDVLDRFAPLIRRLCRLGRCLGADIGFERNLFNRLIQPNGDGGGRGNGLGLILCAQGDAGDRMRHLVHLAGNLLNGFGFLAGSLGHLVKRVGYLPGVFFCLAGQGIHIARGISQEIRDARHLFHQLIEPGLGRLGGGGLFCNL